jgi:hypothetical protein
MGFGLNNPVAVIILQQFRMSSSQSGNGYTWSRTRDIIQFDVMTKTNRLRMSTLFAANAY